MEHAISIQVHDPELREPVCVWTHQDRPSEATWCRTQQLMSEHAGKKQTLWSLNLRFHIYIYIYIYTHIFVYIYIYICVYICIKVWIDRIIQVVYVSPSVPLKVAKALF